MNHPLDRQRLRRSAGVIGVLGALGAMIAFPGSSSAASPYAVNDTFAGTVSSGWGTADQGGTWTASTASAFSVQNGLGLIQHAQSGTRDYATLGSTDIESGTVAATFSVDKPAVGWGQETNLVARHQLNGEAYEARVRIASGGQLFVGLDQRTSSGTEVALGAEKAVSLSSSEQSRLAAGGVSVHLQLAFSGTAPTALAATVWLAGDSMPSSPQVTATDTTRELAGYGSVGVSSYVTSATNNLPVTESFSSFAATDTSPTTGTAPNATPAEPLHGSLPIGSARYAVPNNARYVSPHGSDAAAGTLQDPWQTLGRAIAASPSGSTIVLRGGTYHESDTDNNKQLTIENYPGESVWLTGATSVTNWVSDGSVFRSDNWTAQFPQGGRSDLTDPNYPLAAYPDQLFVDGTSQTQVASESQVVPGTFYVDYSTDQLFMGTNPAGHDVQASDLAQGLIINHADGTIVRGIGFQRYANHPNLLGAVLGNANNLTFANDVFRQNASIGLSVLGTNGQVSQDTFNDNGQLGLHADQANGLSVTNCLLQHNDTEHFYVEGAEGNMKVTRTNGATVENNLSRWSVGRGMWFDVQSSNIVAANNIVTGNADRGIQFEMSMNGVLANNIIANNGAEGISVIDGSNVNVYQNTFWHNTRSVYVVQDNRTSPNPNIPATVSNVNIRNNIFDFPRPATQQLAASEDTTNSHSSGQMGISMNDDAYGQDPNAAWWVGWANYPSKYEVFSSLSSFTAATNQETGGVADASSQETIFANPAGGDFTRKSGSFVNGHTGVPLPSNVAAAMGVPAGSTLPLGSTLTQTNN